MSSNQSEPNKRVPALVAKALLTFTLALLTVATTGLREDAQAEVTKPRSTTGIITWLPLFISLLSVLISLAAFGFSVATYFWPPDGLIANSSFRSSQSNDNTLTVKYTFSNTGKLAHLVEDVGVFEVYKHVERPGGLKGNSDICLDWRLEPSMSESMPPEVRSGLGDFHDGMVGKYTTPVQVTLSDGQHDEFDSIMVPAQEQRAITAKFKTTPADPDKFNAAIICPVFTYMGADGQPRRAICKGWEVDVVSGGGRLNRGDPVAVRLLPDLDKAVCQLTAP